jgi:hypothetical protein
MVEKEKPVSFEAPRQKSTDDDDEEVSPYRYYESTKILGKLFRAIDEREVFAGVQNPPDIMPSPWRSQSIKPAVLRTVWAHVQKSCFHLNWRQYIERARGIRDEYEQAPSPFSCSGQSLG